MMEPTGKPQPRLKKKMTTTAEPMPYALDVSLSSNVSGTNDIIYQSPSTNPMFRKTRSWSARSRLNGAESVRQCMRNKQKKSFTCEVIISGAVVSNASQHEISDHGINIASLTIANRQSPKIRRNVRVMTNGCRLCLRP